MKYKYYGLAFPATDTILACQHAITVGFQGRFWVPLVGEYKKPPRRKHKNPNNL